MGAMREESLAVAAIVDEFPDEVADICGHFVSITLNAQAEGRTLTATDQRRMEVAKSIVDALSRGRSEVGS